MNAKVIALVFIAVAVMLTSSLGSNALAANPQTINASQNPSISSLLNITAIQMPYFPNLTGSGAYERINNGSWFRINTSSVQVPSNDAIPMEGGTYGVEGGNASNKGIDTAYVQVSFSQLSGESDNYYGTGAWSVQLNTNFFYGTNNKWDWIQFVDMNNVYNSSPTQRFDMFGIWNVTGVSNPLTAIYSVTPVYIPIGYLSTATSYTITGGFYNGEIEGEFTISSPSQTTNYFLYQPDTYGLSGKWSSASGTILGGANGSTADFVHPTTETTTVVIEAPTISSAFIQKNYDTGEQNNLSPGSPGGIVLGNAYYVTTQSTE